MNKKQLLDFLVAKQNEYEDKSLIPTLELLIDELKEELGCPTCDATGKVTYNIGQDDEYTEPCPDCHSGDKGDDYDNQE